MMATSLKDSSSIVVLEPVWRDQVVTEEEWAARAERFPEQPPISKEYYLLRSIFQRHFPSKSAYDTVPRVHLCTASTSRPCLTCNAGAAIAAMSNTSD